MNRRRFLSEVAGGIGAVALGDLLHAGTPTIHQPHFAPTAKHVIYMFMEGGPSQYELFDPKPGLGQYHGKPLPESMTKDLKLAFIKPSAAVGAVTSSSIAGASAAWSYRAPPEIGKCLMSNADPFDAHGRLNHPGQLLLFTGSIHPAAPVWGVGYLRTRFRSRIFPASSHLAPPRYPAAV
jgi:hypothetical protein